MHLDALPPRRLDRNQVPKPGARHPSSAPLPLGHEHTLFLVRPCTPPARHAPFLRPAAVGREHTLFLVRPCTPPARHAPFLCPAAMGCEHTLFLVRPCTPPARCGTPGAATGAALFTAHPAKAFLLILQRYYLSGLDAYRLKLLLPLSEEEEERLRAEAAQLDVLGQPASTPVAV